MISIGGDLFWNLYGRDQDVRFVLAKLDSNGLSEKEREWLAMANHYKELSQDLFPVDDQLPEPVLMDESRFVDLCQTGMKIFVQAPKSQGQLLFFPWVNREQEIRALEQWWRVIAETRVMLPALNFDMDPPSTIWARSEEVSRSSAASSQYTRSLFNWADFASRVTAAVFLNRTPDGSSAN